MKKIIATCIGVAAAAFVGGGWLAMRTPSSVFDGQGPGVQQASAQFVQKGAYVARLSDCVACHSIPSAAAFSGGLAMATPLGTIFSTNITPDQETGIGRYSLADFDRALRHGVAKDGHRLYPAMPYPSFAKLSDDDVRALYAYFMNGVQPAKRSNQAGTIPFPLNIRWPLALWSLLFSSNGVYRQDSSHDAAWNRGAYLVEGPGHCGACHTPRGTALNEKSLSHKGKSFLSGASLDGWYAPSLRDDPNTGLGRWSEADIVQFLKVGRNDLAVVFGSMTDAFNNSTQFMSDGDLKAIAHYLKSLAGDPARDGTPWQYRSTDGAGAHGAGHDIYMAKCSFCHGEDGKGHPPSLPPVAGVASSLAKQDMSTLNIVLNGSPRIVAQGLPDAYRMPPLRNQLSDQEVADVVSYVRASWGNDGGAVTQANVKSLRDRTNPASSTVIILQMR